MLHPSLFLSQDKSDSSALILVNNAVNGINRTPKLARHCAKRVLLDGASNRLARELVDLGTTIDLVIGDGDSVTPETLEFLQQQGIKFVYEKDQDATDLMKGLRYTAKHWPQIKTVYAYPAMGGRVDHSWHSIYCLDVARKLGLELYIVSDENITMYIPPGTTEVATPLDLVGLTCGFMPLMGSTLITIEGFEWDVTNWECSFLTHLSTSNHLVKNKVSITTDKPLAFTIELANKAN